ncbi:hypothetical protein D3C75_1271190 [compost metagenome]
MIRRWQDLVGHRHHAQPLLVELVGNTADARQQRFAERDHLIFLTHMATDRQHLFQRALADQLMVLRLFRNHH